MILNFQLLYGWKNLRVVNRLHQPIAIICTDLFPLCIMSYRPIAESNSLKEIMNSPVNSDEDKFNRKIREIRDGMDDKSQ